MRIKHFIIIALGILILNSCKNKGTKPVLPYYLGEELNEVWILPGQVKEAFVNFPNFQLKDQFEVQIERNHLNEKAFVVNFFHGDCETVCSKGMKAMDSLQNRLLEDEVLFLSISLDADRDSLNTLKELTETYHVNPEKWRLLSGDKLQISEISKLVLQKEIAHPNDYKKYNHLYLFDKKGYLRGIYDVSNPVSIETIILDTHLFR